MRRWGTKMKIIEFVPDKKVVWLVTESEIFFVRDKSEWKGSKVCFEISKEKNKTKVSITHIGLVPEIECFTNCSKGWNYYLKESLFFFGLNTSQFYCALSYFPYLIPRSSASGLFILWYKCRCGLPSPWVTVYPHLLLLTVILRQDTLRQKQIKMNRKQMSQSASLSLGGGQEGEANNAPFFDALISAIFF